MKHDCRPLIKAIDAFIRKVDDDFLEILEGAGYADPDGTLARISGLEEDIAQVLKEQKNYFLQSTEDVIDLERYAKDVWPGVRLTDETARKLTTVFAEEFSACLPELANAYMAEIDPALTVSQITMRTTAWAESWSAELGKIMDLNTHTEIEKLLTASLKEGSSVAQFTQALIDSGIRPGGDEYYRARTVAVTEMLRAHSYAAWEAMEQCPAATHKEWVHTGSHRNDPREKHVELSGTVIPLHDTFVLEGADGQIYHPLFPRDTCLPAGESANCHCIYRAIPDDDILGLSLEERRQLQQEAIEALDDDWEKELDAQNRARAGIE